MQVFKLFWKIVNKNKFSVIMMLVIAFGLSMMFVQNSASPSDIGTQKVNIVVVDEDKSDTSKALESYMKEVSDVKDINVDKIEDALFYREIEYVLYIPKGYESNVVNNKEIEFSKKQVPDSAGGYLVDNYAKSFSNTMQSYMQYGNDMSIKEASKQTTKDLSIKVDSKSSVKESKVNVHYYFNFLSYSFTSSFIWAIGFVMLALNKVDMKRRNTVAPVTNLSTNIQLCFGALVLGMAMIGISTLFAYTVFNDGMQVIGGYLYIINLAIWIIPCLALAYLIASVCRKVEVLSGVSNIVCLALAFLGGCFVPQVMMAESVLKVAQVIPSYWFVKANDMIHGLTSMDWKQVYPIYQAMGIQILFGIVLFVIALIISKHNRKNII